MTKSEVVRGSGASRRFLIVDDFPMMRKALKDALARLGFNDITEAVDGMDAMDKINIAMAKNEMFDVLFLDWNMPRMTGFEVIEKVRAHAVLSKTPIIMISAERDRSNVVRALKAGATDYIFKPFLAKTLTEKITRVLDSTPSQSKVAVG